MLTLCMNPLPRIPAGSETVELLLGLLEQSPTINSLYLDWGVTNQDVKRRIKRLLNPVHREQLWLDTYGDVPAHAQAIVGHHSGRFHKYRTADPSPAAATATAVTSLAASQKGRATASASASLMDPGPAPGTSSWGRMPWSEGEATRFLQGLQRYGRDWDRMSYLDFNSTRSPLQCRDFYGNQRRPADMSGHGQSKLIKGFPAWIETVDCSQPAAVKNCTIVKADRWLFPLGATEARRGTGQDIKVEMEHGTTKRRLPQKRALTTATDKDPDMTHPPKRTRTRTKTASQPLRHDADKNRCQHCAKQLRNNSERIAHERVHTGEKPFACKFCDKKFCQKRRAARHERVHTGGQPHACVTCGKGFPSSSNLKIHLRVHTGEKPFGCKFCDKRFSQRSVRGRDVHR